MAGIESSTGPRSAASILGGGLPRLGARGFALFRALWIGTFLAAAAAMLAGQYQSFSPTRLAHAAVLLGAATMLFRRRGADSVAAMLSLAFLLWAVTASSTWASNSAGGTALDMLDRLRFLLFVTAMLVFPSGGFEPRWTRYALGATFLAFLAGLLEALGIVPTPVYIGPAMGCAGAAAAAIRHRFTQLPPGTQRQQIKWAGLGLAAGLFLVASARLAAPVLDHAPHAASLVHPAMLAGIMDLGFILMALGVLIAMMRYRLYDADAALSRSTAYAAITIMLVAIFAGTEAVIAALSEIYFGGNAGAASEAIAAALAAAAIAPLHQRVTQWADRRFQGALAALQAELPARLAGLRETAGAGAIAEEVVITTERALRVSRVALVLEGRTVAARHVPRAEVDAWYESASAEPGGMTGRGGADPLFPLSLPLTAEGAGIAGWLLIGPRPDQSLHGKDDREALAAIAGPVARALWAARRREKRDAANARRLGRIEASIAALGDRLATLETRQA